MRILVCGGRNYGIEEQERLWMYRRLTEIIHAVGGPIIISGGARGVDTVAIEYAEDHNIPYEKYMADWDKHGKAAGPIRNTQMLIEGKPDLVIAFPGGRGTGDMIKKAQKAGIRTIIIGEQNGSPHAREVQDQRSR